MGSLLDRRRARGLSCDLCDWPVDEVLKPSQGLRPGRLVLPAPTVQGWECTNAECGRWRGFPMGARPKGLSPVL